MRGEVSDKEIRRAVFYKKNLFIELPSGITVSRAAGFRDITDALKLVHDNYVEKGYINPSQIKMRLRSCDISPDMVTYIAKKGDEIVGVQSYISDDAGLGIPADRTFPDEINVLRKLGKVCEFTNCCVCESYRKTSVAPWLMRACYAHAINGQDFLVAQVSPPWREFWKMNLFGKIADERCQKDYPKDTTIAMVLDMRGGEERAIAKDEERGEAASFLHNWWYDNPFSEQVERDDETALACFERDYELFRELEKEVGIESFSVAN